MHAPSYQTRSTPAEQGLNYGFIWQNTWNRPETEVTHECLSFASSENESIRPRVSIGSAFSAESMSDGINNYQYSYPPQQYSQEQSQQQQHQQQHHLYHQQQHMQQQQQQPQQQSQYPYLQQYQQNSGFNEQQIQQISTPYYRSQGSIPSTSATDYESKVPSRQMISDEYQSPTIPAFVVPQVFSSIPQQSPIPQIYPKQEHYAGQEFQPNVFTNSSQPLSTQWSNEYAQSAYAPSTNFKVKIETKSVPINNGIIEDIDDDEDEEEEQEIVQQQQQQTFQQKFEYCLSVVPFVKLENVQKDMPVATITMPTVPCLPHSATLSQPASDSIPPTKRAKPIKKQTKPKKKYKQSRQKNVFKNFGNALVNCIQNNFVIRDFIEKRIANPALIDGFHNAFLAQHLNNLKNKEDFLSGWRASETSDSQEFNLYREVFREISLTFFHEYAEKYVDESDKLKNKDIHIKAIPLFIKGILNVNELYKFRLS